MKFKVSETAKELFNSVTTNLIGNGGQSRAMIMLNKSTGEIWTDLFYDHQQNSWINYSDANIVTVGKLKNALYSDLSIICDLIIYLGDDNMQPEYFNSDDDTLNADTILNYIKEYYEK